MLLAQQSSVSTFLYRWFPALLIMVFIYTLSGTPAGQVGEVESSFQKFLARCLPFLVEVQINWLKVGHVVGYALLGLAFYRGFSAAADRPGAWAVFACLLYAVTDEIHQSLIPGRSASFADVALDTLAAASILAVRQIFLRFAPG